MCINSFSKWSMQLTTSSGFCGVDLFKEPNTAVAGRWVAQRAIRHFDGSTFCQGSDHHYLTLARGEEIDICLERGIHSPHEDAGWYFGRKKQSGDTGWIPPMCIICPARFCIEDSINLFSVLSDEPKTASAEQWVERRCIRNFDASSFCKNCKHHYLSLTRGEAVEICLEQGIHLPLEVAGWYLGRKKLNGDTGLVPPACIICPPHFKNEAVEEEGWHDCWQSKSPASTTIYKREGMDLANLNLNEESRAATTPRADAIPWPARPLLDDWPQAPVRVKMLDFDLLM